MTTVPLSERGFERNSDVIPVEAIARERRPSNSADCNFLHGEDVFTSFEVCMCRSLTYVEVCYVEVCYVEVCY